MSIAPIPQPSPYKTPFVRSFEPFKAGKKRTAEWEEAGVMQSRDKYPHGYGLDRDADGDLTGRFKEVFRSSAEVEWAKTFDKLGLPWEYEPLKFDMGPNHVSYTPDFRVTGLSIPDSNRPLYIEVKRFPDDVDLTKYVRFTDWYNCNLVVLAHGKGGVLKPQKNGYFLVLCCTRCNTYDCFSCDELPTEDYNPPHGPPVRGTCRECQGTPVERIVVPSYFLIQAGTIGRGRVVLPEGTSSGGQISCIDA